MLPDVNLENEYSEFLGWSIEADRENADYVAGAEYVLKDNVTLYAVIKTTPTYTVTYDLNGGSGIAPSTQTIKENSLIELPTDAGFEKENCQFLGWSLSQDANTVTSGEKNIIYKTDYYVSQDTVLYAVWAPLQGQNGKITIAIRTDGNIPDEPALITADYKYMVDANDVGDLSKYFTPIHTTVGAGNVSSVLQSGFYDLVNSKNSNHEYWNPETQEVVWYVIKYQENDETWHIDGVVRNKSSLKLNYHSNCDAYNGSLPESGTYNSGAWTTIQKGTITRPGYTFTGWNTKSNGTGTSYRVGQNIQITRDIDLYAQWTSESALIRFETNGGTAVPAMSGTTDAEIPEKNRTMPTTTRPGYTFDGWYTDAEFTGEKVKQLPAKYPSGITIYYAQWDANDIEITFNANGGENAPVGISGKTDTSITESFPEQQPSRTGYTFAGWNTQEDGNGTAVTGYPDKFPTEDVVYYAQWDANPTNPEEPEIPDNSDPENPTPDNPDPDNPTPDNPTPPVAPVTPQTPATPTPPTATPTPVAPAAPVAVVTPPATNTPTRPVEEPETPQGNIDVEEPNQEVEDEDVPRSGTIKGSWALLNLILAILTVLLSLLMLIFYFIGKHRDDEDDKEEKNANVNTEEEEEDPDLKRKGFFRLLSIIPAIAAVILFVLTEDMRLPMIIIDKWTLWMLVIALINVVLMLFTRKKYEDEDNDDDQAYEVA